MIDRLVLVTGARAPCITNVTISDENQGKIYKILLLSSPPQSWVYCVCVVIIEGA